MITAPRAGNPRHRQRGQGLVEIALVLPLLLLIFMGIFDFGRAVFAYNTATNAAREAARLAIVNQDVTRIEQRARQLAPATPVDSVDIAFYEAGSDTTSTSSADKCLGTLASPITIGCIAVVEINISFNAATPIIGSVIGPFAMTARAELPIEFVCPNGTTSASSCPKQP